MKNVLSAALKSARSIIRSIVTKGTALVALAPAMAAEMQDNASKTGKKITADNFGAAFRRYVAPLRTQLVLDGVPDKLAGEHLSRLSPIVKATILFGAESVAAIRTDSLRSTSDAAREMLSGTGKAKHVPTYDAKILARANALAKFAAESGKTVSEVIADIALVVSKANEADASKKASKK